MRMASLRVRREAARFPGSEAKADFHGNILHAGAIGLDAELSQMMVEMFVRQDGPLLWLEWTEERMRVAGAALRALTGEAVDCSDKPGALAYEVTLC